MVDVEYAKDVLLDIPYVSNIIIIKKHSPYEKNGFKQGLKCDLLLKDKIINIFIGIPNNWERKLISVYIINYSSMPFIPHINPEGKICLFDLEGILIDNDFEGILKKCIDRAKIILEDGFYSNNDGEFVKEFSSYWNFQKPIRNLRFAVPETHKTQIIKYYDSSINLKRKKKESYSSFDIRKNKCEIFAATDSKYFSLWKNSGTQLKGVFFHLEPNKYIIPPDPRKKLDIDYVQSLFSYIPSSEFKNLKYNKNVSLIIFEIFEPGGERVYLGMLLKDIVINSEENFLSLESHGKNYSITAVSISRIDSEFLTQRTRNTSITFDPQILLIGCGSIGGYLCNELVKSGYNNITLIDDDILHPENIYRHLLGMEYVWKYKTDALKEYCEKSFTNANIYNLNYEVEDAINDEAIDLNNFNLIISATGNHNIILFII